MASETEIMAAAIVIAKTDEGCTGDKVPCVSDIGPDECDCVRRARAALDAAEHVREPVVFTVTPALFGPDVRTVECTVRGPGHIVVREVPKHDA